MLQACFTQETEGLHQSFKPHQEAKDSYKVYLEPLDFASPQNRSMAIMGRSSIPHYLQVQKRAIDRFCTATDSAA